MMAKEYTAKFEILAGRTGFNNVALEDVYVQGLPNLILLKVYSQTTLGLKEWNMVIFIIDWLYRGFTELKPSMCPAVST